MNKGEFVNKLSAQSGLTRKQSRLAVDAFIELVSQALAKRDDVLLTGFGKFEARTRKASKRINPQTQKRISVPAKTVPAFKAGKNLKEIVAKKARVKK